MYTVGVILVCTIAVKDDDFKYGLQFCTSFIFSNTNQSCIIIIAT
jgi:predicted permease